MEIKILCLMNELEMLFNQKLTENGDDSFYSTGNNLLDILFMTEYYQKHLDKVHIGTSFLEKVFAMFIRDPRFGIGRRDLGRILMRQANVSPQSIVLAGRYDDLYLMPNPEKEYIDYLFKKVKEGDELAKKWMPRYSSKYLTIARQFAKVLGLTKQQYGHLIKAKTVENTMSRNNWESIEFEHVPSLAAIKYVKAFKRHQFERYEQYIEDVKLGKKELHVSTTNVYDIYRNRLSIDPDVFFNKLEKISGSWIPIVDTSGSMWDHNDSIGKALSVGHYLAKCSTYCPNQVISFSSRPQLITLGNHVFKDSYLYSSGYCSIAKGSDNSQYIKEIASMYTGDCSNTDFGAVMILLQGLKKDFPEYLVVLSD